MVKVFVAFAFAFLVLIQCAIAQEKPSIVSSLHRYQSNNGGFKLSEGDSSSSLEATSYALFLNAVYGVYKVNPEAALRYVQSLENSDFGYANQQGQTSDLESVRNAVLSYTNLKAPIPNSVSVAGYIQSLFNADSGLFANRAGAKGDLKSTAYAVQTLKILNIQDGAFLKRVSSSIHQYLKKIQKDTAEGSYFADSAYSAVTANYYGVLIATLTGYDLQSPAKFVSFIASQQAKDGGFYADAKKTTSVEATSNAVTSLYLLKRFKDTPFADKINVDALVSYVKQSPSDLKSTASAHLAALLVDRALTFSFNYDADTRSGFVDDRIVQGAKFKPSLTASSVIGLSTPNLGVSVAAALPSGAHDVKLTFDAERRKYVASDYIDSSNQLGAATFTYTVRLDVAEIGDYILILKDVKQIGYGVTVASKANLAGKDIKEGETIGIGAELSFGISLHNQTHESLNSGDFDIIFSVLDSSKVTVHTQTINGRGNKDAISFSHTLKNSNLPTGEIYCQFEVKGTQGVHTSKVITYNLVVMLVASEITFDGVAKNQPQYKLGDTAKISFVPGTFPDLRTVYPFAAQDANKRNFYLDLSTTGGVVVHSIKGVADTGANAKYTFTFTIDPTIENIGTHVVSFRYTTASGKDFALSNYDSSTKELFEETVLSFTVAADLRAVNFQERPTKGDFFYGNDITYKFQVKDTKSNKFVYLGNNEAANVFLELKNTQGGKSVVSASQPASIYNDNDGKPQGFSIEWNINPNAVRGAGVLSITAKNADGNTIPLLEEKTGEAIQTNVNIGGDIESVQTIKSFALDTISTVFLVEFNLKCQGKSLKGAELRAVVSYRSASDGTFEELYQLPVAGNDSGSYEVSWATPHKQAPTGEYRIQFFRAVDKSTDKSLLEFTTYHTSIPTGQLPVKTEFLVALLLGAALASVSSKRSKF